MDNIECVIWDTITESAKTRFNYTALSKKLNAKKESIIESIILIIVTDFASGTAKKQIVTKLIQKALQNNLIWEEFEIIHFVDDAEKLFDIEIHTANVVNEMIKEHKDLNEVLSTVNNMVY